MGSSRRNPAAMRAERRAMMALVVVFVMLVQALVPSLALAATNVPSGMTICTEQGLQPAPGDAPAPHAPGGPCDHCVCPPTAAAPIPQLGVSFSYDAVARRAEIVAAPATLSPPARAPPRPPGQGPPTAQA